MITMLKEAPQFKTHSNGVRLRQEASIVRQNNRRETSSSEMVFTSPNQNLQNNMLTSTPELLAGKSKSPMMTAIKVNNNRMQRSVSKGGAGGVSISTPEHPQPKRFECSDKKSPPGPNGVSITTSVTTKTSKH